MAERNRIYGPVPSRRLGMSLGIDLAEFKHCPLDCIYCQLKATTRHDAVRESPAPIATIIGQVRERLAAGVRPDFLTLGGSGEPTLYADLGELIVELRRNFGLPVALLTNAVLFGDPGIRREAALADVVLPSVDAWDAASFELINKPCGGIDFQAYMDGLVAFRDEFRGEIWLEIMILRGISDTPEIASKLAALAAGVRPDRIQLNTPVRPPATTLAAPVTHRELVELATLFTPVAEATADFPETAESASARTVSAAEVLATIDRRPCTVDDIAAGLNAHKADVAELLNGLVREGKAVRIEREGHTWFKMPD